MVISASLATDPVSDMIARVRNGYLAKNAQVILPWSKLKENLAKVLETNKYLTKVMVKDKDLILELKYEGKVPAVTNIKRISKPSLRVYVPSDKLPIVLGGMGIAVISTPKGLMTNKEARKQKLGGEVLCEVW
jgi:small subunit ribosomal protein S8